MNNQLQYDKLYEICRSDDSKTFNSFIRDKCEISKNTPILHEDVLHAILSTVNIFNTFLIAYQSTESSKKLFAHPLLYQLLSFALTYSELYEEHIFRILNFGITHNLGISKQISCDKILHNGDLIYKGEIIGRAVVFSTTSALNGTDKLFAKLDELNNSVKAIQANQRYLAGGYSGLSVKLADGVIEKERTLNEHEYNFLRILEESGYPKAPRYLGVKNDKDLFSYINGETIAYTYEMGKASIVEITKELKAINTISKRYLNDKVYVHGDLGTQNVIFNGFEIAGIIDWDNTFLGEEYDDFIYVFWVWANVGNVQRNDDKMFELLRTMINIYQPDTIFRKDFSDKIWQRMERQLAKAPVGSQTYQRIYNWVKWSQKWVEKYHTKILHEIG